MDIPKEWHLPNQAASSIDIKVERVTEDSDEDSKVSNNLQWLSYARIIDNKLNYPNSALVASEVDAKQFSSIPKRGYEIKGVKILVPTNYTPYDPGHCNLSEYRTKKSCE